MPGQEMILSIPSARECIASRRLLTIYLASHPIFGTLSSFHRNSEKLSLEIFEGSTELTFRGKSQHTTSPISSSANTVHRKF